MNNLVVVNNNNIVISNEFTKKVIEFEKLKKEIEYQESLLKEQLLEIMPKLEKTSVITDGLAIIYKKGSVRNTLDSKKLKEELPDIYQEYSKTSETSPSITIRVSD